MGSIKAPFKGCIHAYATDEHYCQARGHSVAGGGYLQADCICLADLRRLASQHGGEHVGVDIAAA